MLKIAYYEFKKIVRDWRWVLIFLSQPIILITLLGLTAYNKPKDIDVSVYNAQQNSYSEKILNAIKAEKDLKVSTYSSSGEARSQVDNDKSRAAILIDVSKPSADVIGKIEIVENATVPEISGVARSIVSSSVKDIISDFAIESARNQIDQESVSLAKQSELKTQNQIKELSVQIASLPLPAENIAVIQSSIQKLASQKLELDNFKIENSVVQVTDTKNTGKDIKYFDFYASSVIVLLIIMIGLNTSSTTITQERIDGTFERFFVTPFTKAQMIFGKMITFSLVSIALSVITISSLMFLFNVNMGTIWLVLLIAYLSSLVAISLGMLISSFSKSIAESIQIGMLFFFSSLITTTFIFQPETMHPIIKTVSKVIPFTYSINAMREVNILNFGFFDVWRQMVVLVGFIFLFLTLAVVCLKRKSV